MEMTFLMHISSSIYPFENQKKAYSIIGMKKRQPESGLTPARLRHSGGGYTGYSEIPVGSV
jgi:hypothetical protein